MNDSSSENPNRLDRPERIISRRVLRANGIVRPDGGGEARAVLEDEFHNFRVALLHDGKRVTDTFAAAPRFPYSLCPSAGDRLKELVGLELSTDASEVSRYTDARQQCTHQFDIAALAFTHAARKQATERRYDVTISALEPPFQRASISRDGVFLFSWRVKDDWIDDPPPFAGRKIGRDFTNWISNEPDHEIMEAGLVLRRGVFIAAGLEKLPQYEAARNAPATRGCWVQQPERHEQALRIRGSVLDLDKQPKVLTGDDEAWLSFAE